MVTRTHAHPDPGWSWKEEIEEVLITKNKFNEDITKGNRENYYFVRILDLV